VPDEELQQVGADRLLAPPPLVGDVVVRHRPVAERPVRSPATRFHT
jgi:hypothetical protein